MNQQFIKHLKIWHVENMDNMGINGPEKSHMHTTPSISVKPGNEEQPGNLVLCILQGNIYRAVRPGGRTCIPAFYSSS